MKIDPMDFQIRDGFYSSLPQWMTLMDLPLIAHKRRYQIVVLILLATNYIPVAVNHLLMAFYAVSTQHHCRPLGKQEFNYNNITIQNVVPIAPPPPPNSQCEMWIDPGNTSKGTQSCINGYEFEFDNNEWTIVAEWGLVCDRKYVGPLVTTIYFTGVMIGGVIFGYLSDRFGRKKCDAPMFVHPVSHRDRTPFRETSRYIYGAKIHTGSFHSGSSKLHLFNGY
ncbi:SLC22A7 [Lepeophtheirus salmonis]|uniref:SLC22A7 n=1 Tax=Lepeophtheirus salmonis TaxID=72036 RepID=A0A7R8H3Q4_LEPSM|nr:SLC22A7 [Lepeophtheirus salmonis]CAF2837445.1 SLC22A7 [Lepeophtheirus salmonis]